MTESYAVSVRIKKAEHLTSGTLNHPSLSIIGSVPANAINGSSDEYKV